MPVLAEDSGLSPESLGLPHPPSPAQMPPYKTFPYTEAKLDPIYAPHLRSGAENPLPAEEEVLA